MLCLELDGLVSTHEAERSEVHKVCRALYDYCWFHSDHSALKEEASYISPRSLQTSSTFGLIVATITLTSILRYRYHKYFLEKNDLKNLFEEKKIHRFAFGRKPEQPNLNNFVLRRPVNFYVLVVPFKTIPVSRL